MSDATHLEIERTWRLSGRPELPAGAVARHLDQGYLPDEDDGGGGADLPEGRVRRTTDPDGRVRCTHTVKRGLGLVRTEAEREIDAAEFDRLWPRTAGRRISKTRHEVAEGDLVWIVDVFEDRDLVLAEVELPSADAAAEPPAWLAAVIEAEVTDDPSYSNYALATGRTPRA